MKNLEKRSRYKRDHFFHFLIRTFNKKVIPKLTTAPIAASKAVSMICVYWIFRKIEVNVPPAIPAFVL
jgi:hypothetical protein